jgi:hypothetical protein
MADIAPSMKKRLSTKRGKLKRMRVGIPSTPMPAMRMP